MMVSVLPTDLDIRAYYTVTQTCKLLGIVRQTLYKYEAAGRITPEIRDGRRLYHGKEIRRMFYNFD